jgi:hypothetical protein
MNIFKTKEIKKQISYCEHVPKNYREIGPRITVVYTVKTKTEEFVKIKSFYCPDLENGKCTNPHTELEKCGYDQLSKHTI